MRKSSPIFVIGTPRSGTTLTAKILGNHPDIFMPGETHYFDDIYARRGELGNPSTREGATRIASRLISLYGRYNEPGDQKRIESLLSVKSLATQLYESCYDYSDVLSLFMSIQMDACSKRIWGNNAPRDTFNYNEIFEFYPEARIVVCVRDPRDFLGSYKDKWRATATNEVERLKKLYHPVVTSYLWKASMRLLPHIQRLFPEKNVLIMKYEDLVSTPEKKIAELCEYIGVNYDEAMLEINFSNSSDENDSKNKRIFTSSIGKWSGRISAEEAWIAQKICAPEMLKLGYDQVRLDFKITRVIGYLSGAPVALWRGLNANKHKRGPLIPYILKRFFSTIS